MGNAIADGDAVRPEVTTFEFDLDSVGIYRLSLISSKIKIIKEAANANPVMLVKAVRSINMCLRDMGISKRLREHNFTAERWRDLFTITGATVDFFVPKNSDYFISLICEANFALNGVSSGMMVDNKSISKEMLSAIDKQKLKKLCREVSYYIEAVVEEADALQEKIELTTARWLDKNASSLSEVTYNRSYTEFNLLKANSVAPTLIVKMSGIGFNAY